MTIAFHEGELRMQEDTGMRKLAQELLDHIHDCANSTEQLFITRQSMAYLSVRYPFLIPAIQISAIGSLLHEWQKIISCSAAMKRAACGLCLSLGLLTTHNLPRFPMTSIFCSSTQSLRQLRA